MKQLVTLAVLFALGLWVVKKMRPKATPLDEHLHEQKQLQDAGGVATKQGNKYRPAMRSKFIGPFVADVVTPFSPRKPRHGIRVYPAVTDQKNVSEHERRARRVQGLH